MTEFTEDEGRHIVSVRAGNRCEMCAAPGTDWAHRKGRGQQGTWAPSNGLLLCRACHEWCHKNPAKARKRGAIVRGSADPRNVPALIRTRLFGSHWFLLDDDGERVPFYGLARG